MNKGLGLLVIILLGLAIVATRKPASKPLPSPEEIAKAPTITIGWK